MESWTNIKWNDVQFRFLDSKWRFHDLTEIFCLDKTRIIHLKGHTNLTWKNLNIFMNTILSNSIFIHKSFFILSSFLFVFNSSIYHFTLSYGKRAITIMWTSTWQHEKWLRRISYNTFAVHHDFDPPSFLVIEKISIFSFIRLTFVLVSHSSNASRRFKISWQIYIDNFPVNTWSFFEGVKTSRDC